MHAAPITFTSVEFETQAAAIAGNLADFQNDSSPPSSHPLISSVSVGRADRASGCGIASTGLRLASSEAESTSGARNRRACVAQPAARRCARTKQHGAFQSPRDHFCSHTQAAAAIIQPIPASGIPDTNVHTAALIKHKMTANRPTKILPMHQITGHATGHHGFEHATVPSDKTLGALCAEWEITGPPRVREVSSLARYFSSTWVPSSLRCG